MKREKDGTFFRNKDTLGTFVILSKFGDEEVGVYFWGKTKRTKFWYDKLQNLSICYTPLQTFTEHLPNSHEKVNSIAKSMSTKNANLQSHFLALKKDLISDIDCFGGKYDWLDDNIA